MICFNCRKAQLQELVVDLEPEIKGRTVIVKMSALVCPVCRFTTIKGADMQELMRLAADVYRAIEGLLTSDEIRACRQAMGMSQEEFANELGVGVVSVERWELGQVQDHGTDRLIRARNIPAPECS